MKEVGQTMLSPSSASNNFIASLAGCGGACATIAQCAIAALRAPERFITEIIVRGRPLCSRNIIPCAPRTIRLAAIAGEGGARRSEDGEARAGRKTQTKSAPQKD